MADLVGRNVEIRLSRMSYDLDCHMLFTVMFGLLLILVTMYASERNEVFLVNGQVFFDFDDNSSIVNYLVYDDFDSAVRVKYPSNWNVLNHLGNMSGNSILVDFYYTGINKGTGYTENANIVVTNQDEYPISSVEESETSPIPRGIQPTVLTPPTPEEAFDPELLDRFTNITIANLGDTLTNFTLLESNSTIISGIPAHKITYTAAGNQSKVKQLQAWTIKDDNWFVVTYSAEPSAFFNSRTAKNMLNSFLIR